jgi:large exoprotein involved in heme utilization and adhesion
LEVRGATLNVGDGKSLVLAGGNVIASAATLKALGGHIDLGGLAGSGTLGISDAGLSFAANLFRADVTLSNNSTIDVMSGGGGDIAIWAHRLHITGTSSINAGIGLGLGQPHAKAGQVLLDATGDIVMNSSRISNDLRENARGNGGDMQINAQNLLMQDSSLSMLVQGDRGNGGVMNINVADRVELFGPGTRLDPIANQIRPFNAIFLDSGVPPNPNGPPPVITSGNATALNLSGKTIVLSGASIIGDTRSPVGNGSVIEISADRLEVLKDATILAVTSGSSPAGKIEVNADTVLLDASGSIRTDPKGIVAPVGSGVTGIGGKIQLNVRQLTVRNGSTILATTGGAGKAGSITVEARESVEISGSSESQIATAVRPGATGDGGNISIITAKLSVRDGARINAGTTGAGNGGTVTVRATDAIELSDNGQISVSGQISNPNPPQNSAPNLEPGEAGNLEVSAPSIRISAGLLSANAIRGKGGNITLRSEQLQLRQGGRITTNATQTASGGNIDISTRTLVLLEDSSINANATANFGGNVVIRTEGYFPCTSCVVTASSDLGLQFGGVVEIRQPDVDPAAGLVQLSTTVVDPSRLLAVGCEASGASRFAIAGRGGLPPSLQQPLGTGAGWEDWRAATISPAPNLQKVGSEPNAGSNQLVEARGWTRDRDGNLVLTAAATWQGPSPRCELLEGKHQ